MTSSIDVIAWGIAGSVRDAGRPGRAAWGASRGGAVDLASLALANRLVGNPAHCAGIECSGGLHLRIGGGAVMVAVAGALAPIDVVGGPPIGWGAPVILPADATVRFGRLVEGARVYLAVRGGLGPAPAGDRAGDPAQLDVGPDPGTPAAGDAAPRRSPPDRIRLWPGPRLHWFDDEAWNTLTSARFVVSPSSDRVGMRLVGPVLRRSVLDELLSEGMVEGAVQVPPDGQPIVMLADHPVTGGYPVIAVVDPRDLGHLAQLPAGTQARFTTLRS